ncbi:BTAD domain-containing putative transcriptional regulator [Nocardiopsis sp. NPDC050513]|uniref:BTAD domain-containing putative transcriptional regulator n=1 Tax=Nocardiopsis sp. NPDC050513 TaxID=3364338 RepID=UPI0037950799
MRVLLLGPLEVRCDDDRPVDVAGVRVGALLARLALEPGRVVSDDALTDAVWGDEPPAGGANALQALVSRVRRAIGADRIERRVPGYRLVIDPADVDIVRFDRLAQDGRTLGDLAALREAEALWRGPALAGLTELRFAEAEAVRLDQVRASTTRERLSIELAAGLDVLDELRPMAEAHPLDERWQMLLIRSLYAAGRQSDALAAYERTRGRLADDLGLDPSPELGDLHLRILRHEPRTGPGEGGSTGERPRSNLRAQLTSFVGRDDDVTALAGALRSGSTRLITVTGPGGAGKTRLAVEAARRLGAGDGDGPTPEGVWMVELAAVADGHDVAPAVLRAIGAREVGLLERSEHDAVGRLEEYFGDRCAVLVLDNCEHLVDAAAELADRLLGTCPRLRVLATSREALSVGGEHLYPIPPLRWPERPDGVGDSADSPAVRLFRERAAAVRPDFTIDEGNAAAVVEICRRLDGLPLAIELAAARMRALDVHQIAARLDDRFALLGGGPRTSAPRHRTLRSVIAWSWALLSETERASAMRMAAHPGGATIDRVGDVDALAGLVDKSFVERVGDRYRMSETIRSYALDRLGESGRGEEVRREHAYHFAGLAERADSASRRAAQVEALRRLDAEHDNVLAALGFAVDTGDAELGVRLVAAMFWFWHLRGLSTERTRWTRRVLGMTADTPDQGALAAVTTVLGGVLLFESGEFGAGVTAIVEGVASGRGAGGPADALGRELFVIASAFTQGAGDAAPAAPVGDMSAWERGMTLLMSTADAEFGPDTLDRVERARREFDLIGERYGLASALRVLAEHRSRLGERDTAVAALDRAAAAVEELGVDSEAAEVWAELAVAHTRGGAFGQAEAALARAWEWAETSREPRTTAYVRLAAAELLARTGSWEEARRELAAAETGFAATALVARVRVWSAVLRALMALMDGDGSTALRLLDGVMVEGVESAARPDIAQVARMYAAVAVDGGHAGRAAFLLGVAAGVLGTEDRRGYDAPLRTAERARALLGARGFDEHRRRGAELEPGAALKVSFSRPLRDLRLAEVGPGRSEGQQDDGDQAAEGDDREAGGFDGG